MAQPKRNMAALPTWARDEIERLRQSVSDLEDKVTEKFYGGKTNVFIECTAGYKSGKHIAIEPGSRVRFAMGNESEDEIVVAFDNGSRNGMEHSTRNCIHVYATGRYSPSLRVIPRSSNVLELETGPL